MDCPRDWPEPIVRVQSLTALTALPDRYIKPPRDRPATDSPELTNINIPLIDLSAFTPVVDHGVNPGLMDQARDVWREFFHLPMEIKQVYANSPKTYEGYGSRLGVQKGAILDWSDYYYLHYLPGTLKDHKKWPEMPPSLRSVGRRVHGRIGETKRAINGGVFDKPRTERGISTK
ncbi:jasmonate-regulated gene 21 [Actinidia rufa]|uniref:Jasmonate-regulated gene 21 n=1 Tax=Actinidia rufa TaxID=165716 RepID=A0A7J0DEF6_9ERIC|nr:jasmonate-regulated gene 21 [Actinidia rufa]